MVNEWPDVSTAVRALAAAGPLYLRSRRSAYEGFCEALRVVISPLCDRDVGVPIASVDSGYCSSRVVPSLRKAFCSWTGSIAGYRARPTDHPNG